MKALDTQLPLLLRDKNLQSIGIPWPESYEDTKKRFELGYINILNEFKQPQNAPDVIINVSHGFTLSLESFIKFMGGIKDEYNNEYCSITSFKDDGEV